MLQKVIGTIHKNQVTKVYSDKGGFICNFVICYKDHEGSDKKMSVFSVNQEPVVDPTIKSYLFELEVYSIPNEWTVWKLQIRVYFMSELRNAVDMTTAAASVEEWYKDLNNLPFNYDNNKNK